MPGSFGHWSIPSRCLQYMINLAFCFLVGPSRKGARMHCKFMVKRISKEVSRFMAAMERSPPELPEDVILHIFSHLHVSNQQALRLSLLSKQVFGVVQKRQHLVSDCRRLILKYTKRYTNCKDRYTEELKYTHSTLARYYSEAIPLQTLTLVFDVSLGNVRDLELCLKLAVKMGLKNLNLRMQNSVYDYSLPQYVFELESLVELRLTNCVLWRESIVTWPNLKRLSLEQGCVDSKETLDNIIRGSPSIEKLEANGNVANLKHLKINVSPDEHFTVSGLPNIVHLESIVGYSRGLLDFGATEYPNIITLDLGGSIDGHFFTNFARKFPMLKNLFLEGNHTLQRIDLSSTSLKEIRLIDMGALKEASFDVPNLVRFKCKNHTPFSWEPAGNKMVPKLSFIGNSCGCSSCIELDALSSCGSESWFRELNDFFLVELNGRETSVTVRLYCSLLLNEAHQTLSNSVTIPRIKEFSMSTNYKWAEISLASASAILDGILWICQPQTITFVDCNEYKFPKLLHEKLISRSCQDHPFVADFEMLHGTTRFKDWDELSEAKMTVKNISFHLEYSPQKGQKC